MPISKRYADSIYLVWFDCGLSGRQLGMSEPTFNSGLKKLLAKCFLYPKKPNIYWVRLTPHYFFKGDRGVMFIKEYQRVKTNEEQTKILNN